MKLGFVGTGNVGGTLAQGLGKKGHSIILASRDSSTKDVQELAQLIGAHASVANLKDCIQRSEVIFLATPWVAVEGFANDFRNDLQNKILIDCTNPLKPNFAGLAFTGETSGGEFLQSLLPKTKVIKAFNTVGFNIMAQPTMEDRKPVMYFAGNDENARHITRNFIQELGFEPIDAGDIKAARLLEPFALLWITSAYKLGLGRDFAFSIIRK